MPARLCSPKLLFPFAALAVLAACETEPERQGNASKSVPDVLAPIVSAPVVSAPVVRPAHIQSMAKSAPSTVYPSRAMPGAGVAYSAMRHSHAGLAAPPRQERLVPPNRGHMENREKYAHLGENPIRGVLERPVSTFGLDVDTGAYANMRRFLKQGRRPVPDAIRIEGLVNYFDYGDAGPDQPGRPFATTTEIAPTPWNAKTHLLRIGIKAYDPTRAERPKANLVFLVDVSGSMNSPDKLPLLKTSLRLLVNGLAPRDSIAIVTYANMATVALPATPLKDKATILAAIEGLQSGGGTNGGAGIRLAYAEARKAYNEDGINRVILATDGDLNVGVTSFRALIDMITRERKQGVALTVLGFGGGNLNDHLLEQLANKGDGNYAYIDQLDEAQKVLRREASATLQIVAKDVKAQIEFNSAVVAEYRLIGYENRQLARADFNNDKVDAGEIGAGHHVTALYEIALVEGAGRRLDPLRYGTAAPTSGDTSELAFLRLRYKAPGETKSTLFEFPIKARSVKSSLDVASPQFRFAAAVAAFGQILKGGKYTNDMTLTKVADLARTALGPDTYGYRREFIRLVELAESIELAAR